MSTTNGRGEVVALPSREAVTAASADALVTAAAQAIAARGRFLLVRSGGSTPKALFELLATPPYAGRIDWTRTHVFWGDERCVPPDARSSNYRMAREAPRDIDALPAQVTAPAGALTSLADQSAASTLG